MPLQWIACALACALGLAPMAQALDAEALARLEDIDGLSVSPDGAQILFQRRAPDPSEDRYALSWWSIAPDGTGLRRVADGGAPILLRSGARLNGFVMAPAPVFAPDSTSFVVIRREEGADRLWRFWRDGRARLLSEGDHDVVRMAFDGDAVLYAAVPVAARIGAEIRHEGRNGFLFDERFVPFYAPRPLLPRAFATPAGTPREVFFRVGADGAAAVSALEAARLFAPLAAPVGRPSHRRTLLENANVASVWLEARDPTRQGGGAPLTLVAAAPPGGDPFICGDPACVSDDFLGAWRRDNGEIVFARAHGAAGETALFGWRLSEGRVRRILTTQGRLVGSRLEWSCALARDRLICFLEEARAPRRHVAVHLDSGAIETLFDPNSAVAASLADIAIESFALDLPLGAHSWGVFLEAPPRALLSIHAPEPARDAAGFCAALRAGFESEKGFAFNDHRYETAAHTVLNAALAPLFPKVPQGG